MSEAALLRQGVGGAPAAALRSATAKAAAARSRSEAVNDTQESNDKFVNYPSPSPPPSTSVPLLSPQQRPPPAPIKRRTSTRISAKDSKLAAEKFEDATAVSEQWYHGQTDMGDSKDKKSVSSRRPSKSMGHVNKNGITASDGSSKTTEKRVTFKTGPRTVEFTKSAKDIRPSAMMSARMELVKESRPKSESRAKVDGELSDSARLTPTQSSPQLNNTDVHKDPSKDSLNENSNWNVSASKEGKENIAVTSPPIVAPIANIKASASTEAVHKVNRKRKKSKRRVSRYISPSKTACDESILNLLHDQFTLKKLKRDVKRKKSKKSYVSRYGLERSKSQTNTDINEDDKECIQRLLSEMNDGTLGTEEQTEMFMANFRNACSLGKSKSNLTKSISPKRTKQKRPANVLHSKVPSVVEKTVTNRDSRIDINARKHRFDSGRTGKKSSSPQRIGRQGTAKPKSAAPHVGDLRPISRTSGIALSASRSFPNIDILRTSQSKNSLPDTGSSLPRKINPKFMHIAQNIISARKLRRQAKQCEEDSKSESSLRPNRSSPDLFNLIVRTLSRGQVDDVKGTKLSGNVQKDSVIGEAKAHTSLKSATLTCLDTNSRGATEVPIVKCSSTHDSFHGDETVAECIPVPAPPKRTLQAIVQAASSRARTAGDCGRHSASGDTTFQVPVTHHAVVEVKTGPKSQHHQYAAKNSARIPWTATAPVRSSHGKTCIQRTSSRDTSTMSLLAKKVSGTSGTVRISNAAVGGEGGGRVVGGDCGERPNTNNSTYSDDTSCCSNSGAWPIRLARTMAQQLWSAKPLAAVMAGLKAGERSTPSSAASSRSTAQMLRLDSSGDEQ